MHSSGINISNLFLKEQIHISPTHTDAGSYLSVSPPFIGGEGFRSIVIEQDEQVNEDRHGDGFQQQAATLLTQIWGSALCPSFLSTSVFHLPGI